MTSKRDLCREEDQGWAELVGLVEQLSPHEMEEPGYTAEGWSVKDMLAHLAAWMAEAGIVIEQIRWGTYRPDGIPWGVYRSQRLDIDEMNRKFYEAHRDLPLSVVRAELASARNRMLADFAAIQEPSPEAKGWFEESGPAHYREHLGDLRRWVEELRSRR